MLILYGADLSSPCNKVRFAANAMGIDYEYKKVSIKNKENRSPEFLSLHPAGKIPVIDDEGFVLFESSAIIKYLAEKEQSPLYAPDLKIKAKIDQWMHFVTIHIGNAMDRVLFNRVFAPLINVAADQSSLRAGERFLNRFLPVVENHLAEKAYLVGENLTLADINLLATLDPAEIGQIDLHKYSRISQWRNELREQEFYTKCHKKYGEQLKRILGT